MDIKKLVLGGIVGAILFFLLGYLAYVKLFADFFSNHPGSATGIDHKTMQMMYIILANLLWGFLLAFVLVKANVSSVVSGFITAAVVGFLLAGAGDSITYGTSNIISKTAAAADVAIATVMWAICGAIVSMVTGMGKKSA